MLRSSLALASRTRTQGLGIQAGVGWFIARVFRSMYFCNSACPTAVFTAGFAGGGAFGSAAVA